MNSRSQSRLQYNAIMKIVREDSRAHFCRFYAALDQFETLLREIEGKPPLRKKTAKIISLFPRRSKI